MFLASRNLNDGFVVVAILWRVIGRQIIYSISERLRQEVHFGHRRTYCLFPSKMENFGSKSPK